MGGSSSNDTGGGGGVDSVGGGRATDRSDDKDSGVSGSDRDSFDRAMDNAERPDRAPAASADTTSGSDNDDDQRDTDRPDDRPSGSDKSETDEPDRAMDNAERPDRAPPSSSSPADTDNRPDDNDDPDDRDVTNDSGDKPDRAAGPPGIGAPPSATAPADTAKDPDDTDDNWDDRSFIDRVSDTLSAPPTDAEGNTRSTSPVADRIGNHTQNYSIDDIKDAFAANEPPVTPEQSQSLEEGAAVIEGVATLPSRTPTTPTLDPIAAEKGLDLFGRPPAFDDANQTQVADAGTRSGLLSDIGQAIRDDYNKSIVGDVVNAIRDDFNRSIVGNALTDTENLSVEFRADSPFGGGKLTFSDKDKDGEVNIDGAFSAKNEAGSIHFDPQDKAGFDVGNRNIRGGVDSNGNAGLTVKGNGISGGVTNGGSVVVDVQGSAPISPLSRVNGGFTTTTPIDGDPQTTDGRLGVSIGLPGVAELGAEVKARDIFGANDPVTATDQPVDTPAPATGPIDQIAEIEQPDIAQQIAEKKAAEKEQAEAEARARRERSEFGGRAESFADSNGLL